MNRLFLKYLVSLIAVSILILLFLRKYTTNEIFINYIKKNKKLSTLYSNNDIQIYLDIQSTKSISYYMICDRFLGICSHYRAKGFDIKAIYEFPDVYFNNLTKLNYCRSSLRKKYSYPYFGKLARKCILFKNNKKDSSLDKETHSLVDVICNLKENNECFVLINEINEEAM